MDLLLRNIPLQSYYQYRESLFEKALCCSTCVTQALQTMTPLEQPSPEMPRNHYNCSTFYNSGLVLCMCVGSLNRHCLWVDHHLRMCVSVGSPISSLPVLDHHLRMCVSVGSPISSLSVLDHHCVCVCWITNKSRVDSSIYQGEGRPRTT